MSEDKMSEMQSTETPEMRSPGQQTMKGAHPLTTAQRALLWIGVALGLAVSLIAWGLVSILVLSLIMLIASGEAIPEYFAPQYFLLWIVVSAFVGLLGLGGLVASVKRLKKR